MIKNVDQLIENANLIKNETERLEYVMKFFFDIVEYDYSYLLIKGYIQETIEEIEPFSSELDLIENPFKKGGITIPINGEEKTYDDSYSTTSRISKGNSSLLDEIDKLTYNSNGNVDEFFIKFKEILTRELRKHIDNEKIINDNVNLTIERIKKCMEVGNIVEKYYIVRDIKSIITNHLLYPDKYMPPIIENGLLKRGVCKHYANYFQELLPKIGISAKRIDGISEMGHAWISVIVDGNLKSVDLTRAIFIRDNFLGIPKEQTSEDWLISDFEKTFDMQKTRIITGVGIDELGKEILLPYQLNKENFDEKIIIQYMDDKKHIKTN